MGLKNRLAKMVIDPSFRNPGLLRTIFAIDSAVGLDFVKALAPMKLMPASSELFMRCFAHFTSGEIISLEASTTMAAFAPDRASQMYLLKQADEERTHLEHFRHKLGQFGLDPERLDGFVSHAFRGFGTTIRAAQEREDFVGGLIGNNIVVEGLAIRLLEDGCKDLRANSDEISAFLDFVLEDERHHVRFGQRRLKWMQERGMVDVAAATDMYGRMWEHVEGAVREIPDVLDAMGVQGEDLLANCKRYYREQFAVAGLEAIAA